MLKEVTESTKEIWYAVIDHLPALFPKRSRRVRWANLLPSQRANVLVNEAGDRSSLGWAHAMFVANQYDQDCDYLTVDGIVYKEFLPSNIRNWFGITEVQALKIQAMDLNKADLKKVVSFIKKI